MNIDEAFEYVSKVKPKFLHISGKTSTGKSTFSRKLRDELGYIIIELDKVVNGAVIEPLGLVDRGLVFYEVYKKRNRLDWINLFVSESHKILKEHENNGSFAVLDGAIANMTTLKEILLPFPATKIIYLHPNNIDNYKRYLTNRFKQSNLNFHNGLPKAFWEIMPEVDFRQFCKDRIITPNISNAIEKYAISSQNVSEIRLKELKNSFTEVILVEI